MSDNIKIDEENGIYIIQYQPTGVCCRYMHIRIKDDIILEADFVGGCNGNLGGISVLIKGMNVNEAAQKLRGIPCGSRQTSCPDQLSKGIDAYIQLKSAVKA